LGRIFSYVAITDTLTPSNQFAKKNVLSLRQFFFVSRINFILFGGTQGQEDNKESKPKAYKQTEQHVNDMFLRFASDLKRQKLNYPRFCHHPETAQKLPFLLLWPSL
jgi:hypothetical protein